jgi:hypothetical protein
MVLSTLKKNVGKLGRVMIQMGTALLHLSREKTVLQQQDLISSGSKKDFQKPLHMKEL